ncbi:MAG: pucM [Caulobacteraceae bacterium]|nr:pucM [Caulobacteraceae bacterium]
MAGRLTTHALDTVRGTGCAGLRVELRGADGATLADATLDAGGRATLSQDGLPKGVYELVFHAADYHRTAGETLSDPPFLDLVTLRFGVADPQAHHHVPLILTPYGYSTYRGG